MGGADHVALATRLVAGNVCEIAVTSTLQRQHGAPWASERRSWWPAIDMRKHDDDAPVASYGLPARSAYTPLFSPRMDSLAFVAPIIVAFSLIPTLWTIPTDSVPYWAWVPLVVCVDVAHVWATVFRTYLDHRELLRRPSLYLGVPMGVFAGSFALYRMGGSQCFWTANSYIAIHHFVKQDLGLLFLFIARFGQRLSKR